MPHVPEQRLNAVRRIYGPGPGPGFCGETLAVLCDLLDAPRGLVMVREGEARPRVLARKGLDLPEELVAPALVHPEPVRVAEERLWIRATHRGRGWSVWLLERDTWPEERIELARLLEPHLGFAGEIGLRPDPLAQRRRANDQLERVRALEGEVADVIRLVARGYSYAAVGRYLSLPEARVRRRLQKGYRALGIAGWHELDVSAMLTDPKPGRG